MQTDATLLDAVCCVRWHILLNVVASCCVLLGVVVESLKPVKLFSQRLPTFLLFCDHAPKRSATMLDPFAPLFQHCWGHARAQYTWPCTWSPMVSKVLWVVSFPRCTPEPKIVGSCCIRFHIAAKNGRNNSQLVSPTMLRVATSVCAHPKTKFERNVIL